MKTNNFADSFRKNISPIEQIFWYRVRGRRLGGYKIRRQQSIGHYVVDFYCAEKKVVIELDGPSHGEQDQLNTDEMRQKFLEEKGFVVIRYRNDQIFHNLEIVLEDLLSKLNSINPSP